VMEPWLDEALTEYITLCYYGHRYGEAAQQEQYRQSAEFPYLMGKAYGLVEQAHDRVGLPTTSFPSDFSYSAVVYNRGAMMFSALAQEIGQKKLLGALGVYYHEYAGRRATKDDLLQVLDRETGFDCTGFLNDWL
jgi:aminopeptidase N